MRQSLSLNHMLLGTVLCLNCFGLLAIATSSALKGFELFANSLHYLLKQAVGVAIGLFIIIIVKKIPKIFLQRIALPLFLIALTMLVLLYIPGFSHKSNGAGRWLRFLGLTFQPSEFAKLALIFILAKNLSLKEVDTRIKYITSFTLVGIFLFLLLFQPDFGSGALIILCSLGLFYLSGMPAFILKRLFVFTCGFAACAIAFAPYRLKRLLIFLDPWSEFKNGGFQIIQSYLAFQNGSIFGVGFGESKQKLFYLPEAHTDFIFSVIAEECGLIACLLILSLFFFLWQICLTIAAKQKDEYFRFLAYGLTLLIIIQSCFNFAVVSGLLPTKGITLPFISSGASSLITLYFAIAVLLKLAD